MSFHGVQNLLQFEAFYTLGSTAVFYLTKLLVGLLTIHFHFFVSDIVVKRPDLICLATFTTSIGTSPVSSFLFYHGTSAAGG